ncbi:hypothetical protein GM3708_1125 [Geminocystis sp. NIES-3708]|nr:hypothetical protein GM3708_1125 [Geminocystis sp. NIES-3708]
MKERLEFPLRVGKYRLLFLEDTNNSVYVIITIASKDDTYK